MSIQNNDDFFKMRNATQAIAHTTYILKRCVLKMHCLAQKLENVIFNCCIIAEPGF